MEGMQQVRTAYDALDDIRDAATVLVAVAMERLREVEAALVEGRFDDADDRCRELMAKIQPLALAEQQIGVLKGARIARMKDITVGTEVVMRGRVTEREEGAGPCGSGDHPNHPWVKLTFDDSTHITLRPDTELAIRPDSGA